MFRLARYARAVPFSLDMMRFFGLSACVVGVVALAARWVDVTSHAGLIAAVFAPYLMLALPVGAVVLLWSRRWLAAALAVVLTVAAVITQVPPRPRPVGNGVPVRVMSANTLQAGADARRLVDAATGNADIVAVQELTPTGLKDLSANNIDAAFPHRITKPLWGGSGAGLWSRYPLTELPADEFEGLPIIARLDVPGTAEQPTVVVAHLSAPWPWPIEWWRSDIAQATEVLGRITGPVIAVGDFNSTRDIAQFRRLLDLGFDDATARTYPSGRRFPPLLAIDHILTRRSSWSQVQTLTIEGSDHRALIATVHVPTGPQGSVVDDFDGPQGARPDPGLWGFDVGPHRDDGLQTYTDAPDNVRLDGRGHLVIEARATPGGYTSARAVTRGKLAMRYGRISARITFPFGQGIWPAFWLLGSDYTPDNPSAWPACGEIDIMELVNDGRTFHVTLHGPQGATDYYGGAAASGKVVGAKGPIPDLTDGFHDYWLDWQPDSIVIGVDDRTLGSFTPASLPPGAQWVFNRPMYALLNVAVGGPWPGPPDASTRFPATMLIDRFSYTPN